ncbi:hypothetical protein DL157_14740 [Salmonella enterica subsp. enterica serovar Newport]|nr:hypothetical protein [Salmonella enterica subsp. enterica serovar Newport]
MYPVSNHNAKRLCADLIEERGPVALAPLMSGKPTLAFNTLSNLERLRAVGGVYEHLTSYERTSMGAILINASISYKRMMQQYHFSVIKLLKFMNKVFT